MDRDDKQYKEPYEAGYEKREGDYVKQKKNRKEKSYDRKYKKPYEAAYGNREDDKDDYVKEKKEQSYDRDSDKYQRKYKKSGYEESEGDDDDYVKEQKEESYDRDLDIDDKQYKKPYEERDGDNDANRDDDDLADIRKRHKPSPYDFISDAYLFDGLDSVSYDLDKRIKDNFGYPEYAPFYVGSEWINHNLIPFYKSIVNYSKGSRNIKKYKPEMD